jgi:hypothetical protein
VSEAVDAESGSHVVTGGRYDNGYCTRFYCVVPWFDGVENEWSESHDDRYWRTKYGGEWYPKYRA